jgi:hypothetical protein
VLTESGEETSVEYLKIEDSSLEVLEIDTSKVGAYKHKIKATSSLYPNLNEISNLFEITIDDPC